MKVKIGVYSMLRRYLNPPPPLGEYIELELQNNETVKDVVLKLGLPLDDIAIILINGKHQKLEYVIQSTDKKIALFPVSGGG